MNVWVYGVALVMLTAGAASGQSCAAPRAAGARADSSRADIVLFARVHADELRFNSAPDAHLQVGGCPQLDTTHVVVRTNIPTPVQAGVTYRNVQVDFRLTARFAEINCYLAELLPGMGADTAVVARARRECVPADSLKGRR